MPEQQENRKGLTPEHMLPQFASLKSPQTPFVVQKHRALRDGLWAHPPDRKAFR